MHPSQRVGGDWCSITRSLQRQRGRSHSGRCPGHFRGKREGGQAHAETTPFASGTDGRIKGVLTDLCTWGDLGGSRNGDGFESRLQLC